MTNQARIGNVEVPPSRSWVPWLACAAGGLATLLTGAWYFLHWDYTGFLYQALLYRVDPTAPVDLGGDFFKLSQYLADHWQGMTEGEVIALLGRPTVTNKLGEAHPWFCTPEWLEQLDLQPDGSEHVIWYTCDGLDRFGDDSAFVYFIIREGKVIRYGDHFP